MPDKARSTSVSALKEDSCACDPATNTITQEKIRTTIVRTAVATVESVCRIPHLARIEVIPAKKAEPTA